MAKLARDGQGRRGETRDERREILTGIGGHQEPGLVENLLDTSGTSEVMDWELKRTKKKKKKVRMLM